MKRIELEFASLDSPASAIRSWRGRNDVWFLSRRYHATFAGQDEIAYSRTYVPGICVLLAIFTFPIGLLALLVRSTAVLTVKFLPRTESSVVVQISGHSSTRTTRELEMLASDSNSSVRSFEKGLAGSDQQSA